MDIEDREEGNKKSELTILKEEIIKLREENRQLKERCSDSSQRQFFPTQNRFASLTEAGPSGVNPGTTDDNEFTAHGSSPRNRGDNEEWMTVLRKKNQRQVTPSGERREKRTRLSSENVNSGGGNAPVRVSLAPRKAKVPPISIYRQDVKDTIEVLSKVLKNKDFKIQRQNDKQHKLILSSYEEHKKAKEILKEVDTQFYTYTPKEEKAQTFMLKGVDGSFDSSELLAYLKEQESENLEFISVVRHTTPKSIKENRALPLYRVQITSDSVAGKLHEIKYLAHQVIWWEKIKKSSTFQCKNCQRLGHTASNCNMKYRCVKCDKSHGPKECTLSRDTNEASKESVYCVLCKSFGHPASYRGCPKQVEFITNQSQNNNYNKRMNSRKTTGVDYRQPSAIKQLINGSQQSSIPRVNYADRVKGSNSQTNNRTPTDLSSIVATMQQQFVWVMQAIQNNSKMIDSLFALLNPSQPTE